MADFDRQWIKLKKVARSALDRAVIAVDRSRALQVNPSSSLFISGFPRSGTTWLQQALVSAIRAKSIFEPFYNDSLKAEGVFDAYRASLPLQSELLVGMYMPFCEINLTTATSAEDRILYRVLLEALRGSIAGNWARKNRTSLAEAFRTRIVVKDPRASLCLCGIQNTFNTPIVHIIRDPRAVVSSFLNISWAARVANDMSVEHLLLRPHDKRRDFFGRWTDSIKRYDSMGPVARVAHYWALTEKYVRECIRTERGRLVFVSYEALVSDPIAELQQVLKRLGIRYVGVSDRHSLLRSSVSTAASRKTLPPRQRVDSWKTHLQQEDIRLIEKIATEYELDDLLLDNNVRVQIVGDRGS